MWVCAAAHAAGAMRVLLSLLPLLRVVFASGPLTVVTKHGPANPLGWKAQVFKMSEKSTSQRSFGLVESFLTTLCVQDCQNEHCICTTHSDKQMLNEEASTWFTGVEFSVLPALSFHAQDVP